MNDGWIERKPTPGEEMGRMDEAMRGLSEQLAAMTKRAEQVERERDSLQRHYDAAGTEHNLLALLDLYHDRAERAEADLAFVSDTLQHGTDGVTAQTETGSEALRWSRQALAEKDSLTARCARAEADNAAVLGALTSTVATFDANRLALASVGVEVDFPPATRALLIADHPGAALLERLRALEAYREALLGNEEIWRRVKAQGELRPALSAALDALDALKAPRE